MDDEEIYNYNENNYGQDEIEDIFESATTITKKVCKESIIPENAVKIQLPYCVLYTRPKPHDAKKYQPKHYNNQDMDELKMMPANCPTCRKVIYEITIERIIKSGESLSKYVNEKYTRMCCKRTIYEAPTVVKMLKEAEDNNNILSALNRKKPETMEKEELHTMINRLNINVPEPSKVRLPNQKGYTEQPTKTILDYSPATQPQVGQPQAGQSQINRQINQKDNMISSFEQRYIENQKSKLEESLKSRRKYENISINNTGLVGYTTERYKENNDKHGEESDFNVSIEKNEDLEDVINKLAVEIYNDDEIIEDDDYDVIMEDEDEDEE